MKIHFKSAREDPIYIKSFGDSMIPLFLDDDIITVKKASFKSVATNDIVTFSKGSKYITHRVIYKTNSYLVTKGDNNILSDGKIFPKQLVGKATTFMRNGIVINPEDIYLFQSTLYFKEILSVKKAFESKNLTYLFLKGLPLRLFFEKKYPRRLYADCDLLIDKRQFDEVDKIFKQYGYMLHSTKSLRTTEKKEKRKTELSYYKKISGFFVHFEVHFEPVFSLFQLDGLDALYSQQNIYRMTDEFLANKIQINIQNRLYPVLSPAHLIVYLSLHFFHDNFKGIHKLEFINTIWRHYAKKNNIQSEVIIFAHKYSLENFISPTFYLLNKYFDTNIPQSFFSRMKVKSHINKYIGKSILSSSIFDSESKMEGGKKLFLNLLNLSPNPFYRRVSVFGNAKVIHSISNVLFRKLLLTTAKSKKGN